VTPFSLDTGNQVRPPAPPVLTSVEYASEVQMVQDLGALNGSQRTPEQTEIARFWGYGPTTATPPGHWNQIAIAALGNSQRDLVDVARLFALLNIAMADAAIASWDCKYVYGLWRPITAIQLADQDGNPLTNPDTTWEPLLATPPFPEYTSGHSTFSGAAAVALAAVFGRDHVRFAVGSDDLPGVQRSFRSFSQAASESGLSRILGGIHFWSANVNGLDSGAEIGRWVVDHELRRLHGNGGHGNGHGNCNGNGNGRDH
jgi:membrane-associated phospholipid phosphatase